MPQETEEEDDEDYERVVDAKVAEVSLDTEDGFAERVWAREGGEGLDELPPWTFRGEGRASGGGSGGEYARVWRRL